MENNSLIARIVAEMESAGHVYVEYWSNGTGRLRSKTVASGGTTYTVYAVRLRPNTEYHFQVFLI